MTASDHLQPRLFDPGPELTASEQDLATQQRMGRELATFGDIAVSAPRSAAESIAATGVIMTQHETKTSEGAYNPSNRASLEQAMGYEQYPVYGALRRSPHETPHYGNVNFHLKPEVKSRSRMYPGDSLNDWGRAVPEPRNVKDVAAGDASAPTPFKGRSYDSVRYVEAHVGHDPDRIETVGFGTARIPLDDVARVSIHEGSGRFDPGGSVRDAFRPRNFDAGEALAKKGLRVDHVLTDHVEQPSLPMEYRDGPQPSSVFGRRRRVVPHEQMTGRDRWGSD